VIGKEVRFSAYVAAVADPSEPRKAPARRAALSAFGNAIPALMTNLDWAIPDEEERAELARKAQEEIFSKNYHQYCVMYQGSPWSLLILGGWS